MSIHINNIDTTTRKNIINALNENDSWKELAVIMDYSNNDINIWSKAQSPAKQLLSRWGYIEDSTITQLVDYLKSIGKSDIINLIPDKYLIEEEEKEDEEEEKKEEKKDQKVKDQKDEVGNNNKKSSNKSQSLSENDEIKPRVIKKLITRKKDISKIVEEDEEIKPSIKKKIINEETINWKVKYYELEMLFKEQSNNFDKNKQYEINEVKKQYTSRLECAVCLENEKCILLLPCNHMCICEQCSNRINLTTPNINEQKCPICNSGIRIKSKIFY